MIIRNITIALALLVTLPAMAHEGVKVVVIPMGGDEPQTPTFKKIFYTDEVYSGNLGGIFGADQRCQASASNAGVKGTFKAWVGLPVEGRPARPDFSYYNLPYQSVDGAPVALHFLDFLTDSPNFAPFTKSVTGDGSAGLYWTGISNIGHYTSSSCSQWQSSSPNLFATTGLSYGIISIVDQGWSDFELVSCNQFRHLLCFEQ